MNDTKITNSDSDVSECNSWTVLCECGESDNPNNEKCGDCRSCPSDLVIVENAQSFENAAEPKSFDSGYVTCSISEQNNLDASLNDYELLSSSKNRKKNKMDSRCKSKRKRRDKNKSIAFGTLFIIGAILAISAASILCLMTPKNVNSSPSTVNHLQANRSKLGVVNDVSLNHLPSKTSVSRYGSKLNIQDKGGSLQKHLTTQSFTPNNTLNAEKCFDPLTYEQFEKKIDAFNKQYGPTPSLNEVENKQAPKLPLIIPLSKINVKPTETSNKIEHNKITKNTAVIENSTSKTQIQSQEMLLHFKLVCNIFQDLMLLRLTHIFAKQLLDKKKIALKKDTRQQPSLNRPESLVRIKKPSISNTAVKLWDELPFHQEFSLRRTMKDMMEEDNVQKVTLPEEDPRTKNRSLEKHRKRQLDYLKKLKQEHNNRIAYLKSVRERQQESIQALIQKRKQDFKTLNRYADQKQHIMEGKRRLLEIDDYYNKLKSGVVRRSISNINDQVINDACVKSQIANLKIETNPFSTISSKTYSSKEKSRTLLNVSSTDSECQDIRKKYYEQVGSYWSKREEYLNERIGFMKDVSGCLKEVMGNFRKTNLDYNSNSKCVLKSIISKARLVFPDNVNLQRLKFEAQKVDSGCYLDVREDFDRKQSGLKLNRYCSLHTFDNKRHCPLVVPTNKLIRDDMFYNEVMERKGNKFRRKDLAIWHYKKFPKTIRQEFSQQN